MSKSEFDRYASDYHELQRRNIAISGEEPAHFADYKMRDFKALIKHAGLPQDGRYLDFGSSIGATVTPFLEHMPRARLVCADVSADSLAVS